MKLRENGAREAWLYPSTPFHSPRSFLALFRILTLYSPQVVRALPTTTQSVRSTFEYTRCAEIKTLP